MKLIGVQAVGTDNFRKFGFGSTITVKDQTQSAQIAKEEDLKNSKASSDAIVAAGKAALALGDKNAPLRLHEISLASRVASEILFDATPENFEVKLDESMGVIAKAIGADRMYIWQNEQREDGLYCTQVYESSIGAEPQQGKKFTISTPYSQIPRWQEELSNHRTINDFVDEMPANEREGLEEQGIKSILVEPVFIKNANGKEIFWGFVGFDNCTERRKYTEDEEAILRYSSKLFSSTWIKNQAILKAYAMQEETKVAQQQAEEARQIAIDALRVQKEFLSNMSHELRSPLNAIMGMSTIGQKAEAGTDKNIAFKKIDVAAESLLNTVNDILDTSKIQAGKFEFNNEDYDFGKMIDDVVVVNAVKIGEKRQNLKVDIDERIPKYIIGDDKSLSRVLTNLLSNATKFTPEGGSITLSAVLVSKTDKDCEIRMEVQDSGKGMTKDELSRVFNRFEQANNTISKNYGGTGLGLPYSKSVIELMGGTMHQPESTPGKGSKFGFTIKTPIGKEPKATEVNLPLQQDEFKGKKILVAEDVGINQEILEALLEDSGLEIEFAHDGKKALQMMEENSAKYGMVFMDIQMPEMDGYEAAEKIRALGIKTPIVAMTANCFKEDIDLCHAAGMDGHVGKPFDIDAVTAQLRAHLSDKK